MNSIMNPIHFRNAPKFTIGVLFRIKHAWFVINLNTSMKSNRAGYVEHAMKSVVTKFPTVFAEKILTAFGFSNHTFG